MFLKSGIIGTSITFVLVVVLASSRLFDVSPKDDMVMLNDLEVLEMPAPPPPPELIEPEPDEPEPEPAETAPPAPSVELPMDLPSPDLPTIAPSPRVVSLRTPLQAFHVNLPPSEIAKPKQVANATPRKSSYQPSAPIKRPTRKVAIKSKEYYSVSQLDRVPSERRKGRFTWPRHVKSRSGVVKLHIEINTSGRVRVIRVVSSSDPALTLAAKKVATGSLFTIPTFNGQAVKTQFFKSYRLQKPR